MDRPVPSGEDDTVSRISHSLSGLLQEPFGLQLPKALQEKETFSSGLAQEETEASGRKS